MLASRSPCPDLVISSFEPFQKAESARQMRILIVGAGEVGYHVADMLSKEQHDVVVINVDRDRLDYVESHLDVGVLEGSGVNPTVLESAEIRAGLLLAVTSVDEVNLVCCMSVPPRPGLTKVAHVLQSRLLPRRRGPPALPVRCGPADQPGA